MKTSLFICFLLSIHEVLSVINEIPEECIKNQYKYQCSTMMDDKCMMQDTNANGDSIVHLMSCRKDDYCYFQTEVNLGLCFKRKFLYFDKEKCKINPECHSKNCTNGRCVGIPDDGVCDSDYVCKKQSYCNDGICTKIAKEGESCSSENGCPIGYACGRAQFRAPTKCIKVFSIETGQYTSNRLFCKSGFALYIGGQNFEENLYSPTDPAEDLDFICAESSLKSAATCTKNSDCEFEINTGHKKVIMKGKTCICTANGDEGYCQITTDNPIWQRWLELYAQVVNDGLSPYKHTAYNRPLGWGNSALIQSEQDILRFEKFKNADVCARRFLTGANSLNMNWIMMVCMIILALITL